MLTLVKEGKMCIYLFFLKRSPSSDVSVHLQEFSKVIVKRHVLPSSSKT